MYQPFPIELPERVKRAFKSTAIRGNSIRQGFHVLFKTLVWATAGFYAAWTAMMVALLPTNPLAVVSLALQGFSLWYWVKNADTLRMLCDMQETQEPTRMRTTSRMDPITAVLVIAGLPALLSIVLPFLLRFIDQGFLVGLDNDPRRKLVLALKHCITVYRYDPARGKAGEEKLLALVREVDAALAFPEIGRIATLTPEHEDLYARLQCWPADPPEPGELREMICTINATLDNQGFIR